MVYLIREGSGERGMCFSALLVSQYLCHLEKYDEELLVFRESVFFFFFSFLVMRFFLAFGFLFPHRYSTSFISVLRAPCCVLRDGETCSTNEQTDSRFPTTVWKSSLIAR